MSYNPTTVANYFISKYADKGNITPMKLIKLTYIAYGWYLAITGKQERLTDESPQAWDFGPVFPSLFESLKGYGRNVIKRKIPNCIGDDTITADDRKFLDKIWKVYGRFDGIYLSAMTHKEGTPWKKLYKWGANVVLSDDDMFEHYSAKLQVNIDK